MRNLVSKNKEGESWRKTPGIGSMGVSVCMQTPLPHTVTEFLQKVRIPIFSHPMCPENQRSSLAHGIVLKVWIVCFIYLCIYLFVAVGLVYMSIYKSLPSLGLLPV